MTVNSDSASPVEAPPGVAGSPNSPAYHQLLPPVPPPRKGRSLFWIILGVFLIMFLGLTILGAAVTMFQGNGSSSVAFWSPGAKVAVVPVEGEIFDARNTVEDLRRHSENRSVKAIVVRINSPGGAIVPSQEIFSAIRKIRKDSGKPVVASMDSVAASGGYYIAVACDTIVANPGSITGSIGVIAQWMNVEDLLKWARLKPETMTSGRMKDAGSPYKESTPEERAYLQGIITQLHRQFIRAVAEGRKGKLSEAEVGRLADGRVFTGEEAKRLKLIDELGTLDDAVKLAGKMAGMEGDPDTIYPRERERGFMEMLLSSQSAERFMEAILTEKANRFLYRW